MNPPSAWQPTQETSSAEPAKAQPGSAQGSAGAVEVVMPQMGESIFEGTITKWLKKTGDAVKKDEPLFEISTDKVDAEIPSPVDGVLSEIRHAEGDTVEVNTVVAVIGGSGAGAGGAVAASAVAKPAAARETAKTAVVAASGAESRAMAADGRKLRSSPLVRKIAAEHGLDLARIAGTGSDGRITKEDVLAFLKQPAATRTAPPSPAVGLTAGDADARCRGADDEDARHYCAAHG